MFAYIGSRHDMLAHIPKEQVNTIAEIGVCKGENAEWLLSNFTPGNLHLIDPWIAYPFDNVPFYYLDSPAGIKFNEDYFGGPLADQATFDALHDSTQAKFSDAKNVLIHRRSSRDIVNEFDDQSLDLIYIDADHSYEAVLDDLFIWESKLTNDGYIILNDHAINASGTPKFGIVQAVTTFLRNKTHFAPIAMNLNNYADLILGKRSSAHTELLKNLVTSGKIIEVPDSIISNYHVRKSGSLSWLSFC
jgi:hypothetical protein